MKKELKVNILIGTPAYGNKTHTDYLHSIIEYLKNNLPVNVMTIGNESLITRGRNTIISHFYNEKEYTHLLFLDADIHLSANGLVKLLSHEKDVIGAPVALKGTDVFGNPVYNVGNILDKINDDLIETDKVGNAILMLSRKACESLCDNSVTYKRNPLGRGDQVDPIQYDVFKTGVFDNEYYSEDFYICKKLRELEYKVYVDILVQNRHNGNYVFK